MSTVDLAIACGPYAVLEPTGAGSYLLDGCLEVAVVSSQEQLGRALQVVRHNAAAGCNTVAIDLEWKPDFRYGDDNPVSLIQLADDEVCILIRTCLMGFPPELRAFLSDPSLTFVGMNWHVNDARKMASSFGFHQHNFGRFEELVSAVRRRGYRLSQRPGLAELSEKVLGILPPKNKAVTLSNWAQPALTHDQIKYAAVDAALVWHIHSRL